MQEERFSDIQIKRTIKDSVFTHLFRDRKYLFQLYQWLHPEDTETVAQDIEDVTTENVIINGIYNDLGFRVSNRQIILMEAQSTWTENILIRALEYMVHAIMQYLDEQGIDLYRSTKAQLPIPELYVVYTGSRKGQPEWLTLKDCFFAGQETALDVRIRMLYGKDAASILGQYVQFCKTYDAQYRQLKNREQAIWETIRICKEQDVLKEYLELKETEVHDIMFALYDEETLRKIHDNAIRKEEREKGIAEGIEKGKKAGIAEGKKAGIAEGKRAGIAEGIKEGISTGIRNLISSCREFNIDDASIQQKIITKYKLTPERAQAYMQQ